MADVRPDRGATPPPLTVAASLVGLQGVVMIALAVAEVFHVVDGRAAVALSTAAFFAAYGVGLVVCAVGLTRRRGWARGPALLSQLIQLGIAWNIRQTPVVALLLAAAALVALAGILSPSSLAVLMPEAEDTTDP